MTRISIHIYNLELMLLLNPHFGFWESFFIFWVKRGTSDSKCRTATVTFLPLNSWHCWKLTSTLFSYKLWYIRKIHLILNGHAYMIQIGIPFAFFTLQRKTLSWSHPVSIFIFPTFDVWTNWHGTDSLFYQRCFAVAGLFTRLEWSAR